MFHRHSKCLVAFVLASLFISAPAMAATSVGIINVQKIMEQSKAAQSIKSQLQAKQKSFQAELDTKQKQLVQEDQDLVKQRNALAKEAFEKKVKDFQAKAADAQRQIKVKKDQLDKAFGEALNQIQEKVVAISRDIAKEKGMNVILSASQILYGDVELDITDAVLSKLNSDLPSIQVKF